MLNPDLKNRIWQHQLTHLWYRVQSKFLGQDLFGIEVSFDEGASWSDSDYYASLHDLLSDIRSNNLTARFKTSSSDLSGVRSIMQIVSMLESERDRVKKSAHSKRLEGVAEGMTHVLARIKDCCKEVVDRFIESKPREAVPSLKPGQCAEASCDEVASEL